ncbi:ABC transporter ATP-binding protein [Salinicoccus jeotgali]|uniref:ABC transporter ATP-binding protein n=1 Tax=Salinicoccus jeotgali TaxID=381634 RepID=A0ABP7EJQ1_9STAP
METIIKLKNVNKKFKDFSLENLSLDINKGYITGLIGSNGSGKSSTIRIMMDLMRPDSGDLEIFGLNYEEHEKEIKGRIGFVYDSNIYYEGLNLSDIQRIVGPAYRNWNKGTYFNYLKKFNLPKNKPIKTFSKGMQMKASLAIALSHDAELLIMDEPTAGLDPVFRRELLNILQDILIEENRTIFFSTHITSDLEKIADYVAFIKDGRVIFNHSINDLQEKFSLVKGELELLDRDTSKAFVHINQSSDTFEAMTDDVEKIRRIFGDTVIIDKISLEEIMYFFNGDDNDD